MGPKCMEILHNIMDPFRLANKFVQANKGEKQKQKKAKAKLDVREQKSESMFCDHHISINIFRQYRWAYSR